MKNEKVSKRIDNWVRVLEEIKNITKKLDEKPTLVVCRTDSNNFRGFLNKKAMNIAEKIVKGVKYFWLDVCYFDGRDNYFVNLNLSKKYQNYPIRDNTPPSEPGSHTMYPYSEMKDVGQFDLDRISGRKLFGNYFGPSFMLFFLCEDLLEISKEQEALYFSS